MRQLVRRLFSVKRQFSTLNEKAIQTIRHCPLAKQYPGFQPIIQQSKGFNIRSVTDPKTNLHFLVDSPSFPGCTDLGICINLGTRDEDEKTAGSLSYLKDYSHSKETPEQTVKYYDIFQKSGSLFSFDYDTSFTYIKCSCFSEDIDLMLDLLLDFALVEKRIKEGDIKMEKPITDINEAVRVAAYGGKGIGLPSSGIGNILTDKNFSAFQQKITPFNTVFSFSNYPDEQKLIDLITKKIQSKYTNFLSRQAPIRKRSAYVGGSRSFVNPQAMMFEFALAYESCSHDSENMELMNVVRTILGSASSFSSGGPGKGMYSRCTNNLLNKVYCVEKANFINEHYTDSGIFGLTVGGPEDLAHDIIKCTLEQFRNLYSIGQEELDRAKSILIAGIQTNIQGQPERLEQVSKHFFSYGRRIRAVTAKQIQNYLRTLTKKKPTLTCLSTYDRGEQFLSQLTRGRLP